MKTAYELAMERLQKSSPAARPLTDAQKKELGELESKYAAKIAEREISMKGEIEQACESGDFENAEHLRQQLLDERKALQAELERKKEQVRAGRG